MRKPQPLRQFLHFYPLDNPLLSGTLIDNNSKHTALYNLNIVGLALYNTMRQAHIMI